MGIATYIECASLVVLLSITIIIIIIIIISAFSSYKYNAYLLVKYGVIYITFCVCKQEENLNTNVHSQEGTASY